MRFLEEEADEASLPGAMCAEVAREPVRRVIQLGVAQRDVAANEGRGFAAKVGLGLKEFMQAGVKLFLDDLGSAFRR